MDRPRTQADSSLWFQAVRYVLAVAFLIYGGVKLADIQFNPVHQPYLFRNVPANDLTGFEIVWRFFGYSRVYHGLVGLGEVGAAVLLLFARTAPLGAVVYLPIVANVVAVDLCFGVQTDATVVALALLAGDLVLLHAYRARLAGAVLHLLRPSTLRPTRGRTLLAWGCAIVLLVLVLGAGTLAQTLRGGR